MKRHRARASTWAACLVVAVIVGSSAGCSWGDDSDGVVVLIGDSIVQETVPFLAELLKGSELRDRFLGGTAPCDWLTEDLEVRSDRTMVISFSGNSFTRCMGDGVGGQLQGQALVDKYRIDLTTMVDRIRAQGAAVVLVGQPERGPAAASAVTDLEVAGINEIYTDLAEAEGVTFVDAGAAVEAPDGAFAASLPCLPGEAECGPDGTNPVRNPDGVHLCPASPAEPCTAYSSGAYRFATAIADAVDDATSS